MADIAARLAEIETEKEDLLQSHGRKEGDGHPGPARPGPPLRRL